MRPPTSCGSWRPRLTSRLIFRSPANCHRPSPFERFELDPANVAAVLSENLPGVPYKMVPGVPMPSGRTIPEPTPRKLDPGYDF